MIFSRYRHPNSITNGQDRSILFLQGALGIFRVTVASTWSYTRFFLIFFICARYRLPGKYASKIWICRKTMQFQDQIQFFEQFSAETYPYQRKRSCILSISFTISPKTLKIYPNLFPFQKRPSSDPAAVRATSSSVWMSPARISTYPRVWGSSTGRRGSPDCGRWSSRRRESAGCSGTSTRRRSPHTTSWCRYTRPRRWATSGGGRKMVFLNIHIDAINHSRSFEKILMFQGIH